MNAYLLASHILLLDETQHPTTLLCHYTFVNRTNRDTANTDPAGHAISMGVFGFIGYWAYHWDQRAAVLLAQKRAEIAERREKAAAVAASSSS